MLFLSGNNQPVILFGDGGLICSQQLRQQTKNMSRILINAMDKTKLVQLSDLITPVEAKLLKKYVSKEHRDDNGYLLSIHAIVMKWFDDQGAGQACKARLLARGDILLDYAAYLFEYHLMLKDHVK